MRWLIVFFFPFIIRTCFSQINPFPSDQKGLLWKITGNGLTYPSYLFGTMHIMDSEVFLFPDMLDSIVNQSDEYLLEIGEFPNPFKTVNLLTRKEGSFFDIFSKKETKQLVQWASDNFNMNEKMFRSMVNEWKTFAFIQLISQLAFTNKTSSYELLLYSKGKEKGVSIIGLETVEEQLSFFDRLSVNEQKEMVLNMLKSKEKIIEEKNEMQSIYLKEQIDEIYQFIQHTESKSEFSTKQLLDDRNKKWVNILHSKLKENKKLFIAVGAAHLGGTNGLLRGLQQQGFIVTPIPLTN